MGWKRVSRGSVYNFSVRESVIVQSTLDISSTDISNTDTSKYLPYQIIQFHQTTEV